MGNARCIWRLSLGGNGFDKTTKATAFPMQQCPKAKTSVCDGDETEAFVPNTIAEIHVPRIVSVCM